MTEKFVPQIGTNIGNSSRYNWAEGHNKPKCLFTRLLLLWCLTAGILGNNPVEETSIGAPSKQIVRPVDKGRVLAVVADYVRYQTRGSVHHYRHCNSLDRAEGVNQVSVFDCQEIQRS